MSNDLYIIAGLGNPGRKYENTRHNLGFITIDLLAEDLGIRVNKLKFKALIGEGRIGSSRVILVKPQTYMNNSGESLWEIVQFYKIPMENLVVIYDDFDIPAGTLRVRKFGSAGTHNGMRSIIYQLQSDRFPRIRIGMGSEDKGNLINFVIGGFRKEEVPVMEEAVRNAADACKCIVTDGIDLAMNQYNTRKKDA
ncbi:MAG: aminoacyl-tRNA hydrolase [Eubacterium sp.]|nr:aminoacyl-tRNA hydrolase [Eubacterium sp.]